MIMSKKVLLTFEGEERTMARFVMDAEGDIIDSIDLPLMFVQSKGATANGDDDDWVPVDPPSKR